MTEKNDKLTQELSRLDPVRPGELNGAAQAPQASAMLQRILATDPDPEPAAAGDAGRRRFRAPRLALGGIAVAAAVAVALILAIGSPSGDGSHDGLSAALDRAAAAAGSQAAVKAPFTYLKTREVSVSTTDIDTRSWKVQQATTREEWVSHDGSGRMRIVAGPSRFVASTDRAEWEGAGKPTFLTLGFGPRTEVHWLAGGLLHGRVENLPTDPAVLANQLRAEAEAEKNELSIPAATLGLVAEDLRNPASPPALRRALYEAAKRIPGITYLGDAVDPTGRSGVAIGVTSSGASGSTQYSLIFNPVTSKALATETTSVAPSESGKPAGPTLVRASVYLKARGIQSIADGEGMIMSGFESSSASEEAGTSYLVYRVPGTAVAR